MAFVTTNTYIQQFSIAVGFRPQIEERAHPKSRLKKKLRDTKSRPYRGVTLTSVPEFLN